MTSELLQDLSKPVLKKKQHFLETALGLGLAQQNNDRTHRTVK
jgi:hypothetical protein